MLILGLSGVGKTDTSNALAGRHSLRHIDMYHRACFKGVGLPSAWDSDLKQVDFAVLACHILDKLQNGDEGAVLSFPADYRFDSGQIAAASAHAISTVILWGPFECCWESRCKRQESRGKGTPSRPGYCKKNEPTFEFYSHEEFERFRVQALNADCSRPAVEQVLAEIDASLAVQREQCLANNGTGQAASSV